ncbi:hypothetical protein K458DRAFT_310114 [Lentithecium fluviatile CBS 122367]|uniref:Uncharacterized protein n=1 Tax=Lentithecium fluviatile CBS 122367 TaxID=1168545 RepID=A0A6G1IT27_9PLEO|nr:hypothetical protein K458DRAFT_310114 [Lentithecium fluviatile CBS 122367]
MTGSRTWGTIGSKSLGTTGSKTWGTTVTRIDNWPEDAKPLKRHNWLSYCYMVGDVVLVLLPIYFILLGVAAVTLHTKPTKDNIFGPKVEAAINLGPTVFPIVFAAICGRSMKMIARHLAERGAKLSTLELLMASQSVWGTVESQLLMQRLTLVGAHLLFLWALSPLGGQASLRLIGRSGQDSYATTKLRYLTTGPGGTMWGVATTYVANGQFADAGALYTAALLTPQSTKIGPRDSWGNVKIPRLEALNMTLGDNNGWVTVPGISEPETYSSLVGLPIVGLPADGKSNFTLESTYLSVECGNFTQLPYPGMNGTTANGNTNWTKLDEIAPGQIWVNKSIDDPFGVVGRKASFFLDTDRNFAWALALDPESEALLGRLDGFVGHINQSRLTDLEVKKSRNLMYVSQYALSPDANRFGLNMATCSLSQNHVEVMVYCDRDQCSAAKIRNSLVDTRPSTLTGFEHGGIAENFIREFPRAVTFATGSSPTEHFLSSSSSFPFIQQVGQPAQDVMFTNVSVVPPDVFSRRLSLLLNTYYQVSIQPTGYWGGLSKNLSAYGPDTLPVTDIDAYLPGNLSATGHSFFDWFPTFSEAAPDIDSPFIGATTTGYITSTKEIFVCKFAWFALLVATSSIIFLTGLFALVLKRMTLGPELFGFVTSMTYENPHMRILEGGSTLDVMERARFLKDVQVFVGDVQGDQDVGHIAFAAGAPHRKLERGRLYA